MNEEVLQILDTLAHLRDLPRYKNIKIALENRLQEIEDGLAPKEDPKPAAKAIPSTDEPVERRV